MKKRIIRNSIFETIAGQTKPGQKIASFGVSNMSKFCVDVNKLTVENGKSGIVRIKVKVDDKKNWEIKVLESPPITILFKNLLDKSGKKDFLDLPQPKQKEIIEELAKTKLPDLNTEDPQKASKTIAGSLRSFGIKIE